MGFHRILWDWTWWFFMGFDGGLMEVWSDLPSGHDCYSSRTWSHGPVEMSWVFPINMVDLSIVFCLSFLEGNQVISAAIVLRREHKYVYYPHAQTRWGSPWFFPWVKATVFGESFSPAMATFEKSKWLGTCWQCVDIAMCILWVDCRQDCYLGQPSHDIKVRYV